MFGLTINYEKSTMIPLNCSEDRINRLQACMGCSVASLPIRYLGIPLGANPRRKKTWRPIIENIEKRLSGWRANLLSKESKLVLIKSVLNNLPLYYLGLFRTPKGVAKIIFLQSKFFRASGRTRGLFRVLVGNKYNYQRRKVAWG